MKGLCKKLGIIFPVRQRLRFVGLFFLIFIGTIFDFLGVSMVLPLVNVLLNPAQIQGASWYVLLQKLTHIQDTETMLLFLTIAIIAIYVIKNAYAIFLSVIQTTFLSKNRIYTCTKLLACYMRKPYTFHLQHNTAEVVRSINNDVVTAFALVLNIISLISNGLITILLVAFLISVDPVLTLSIVAGLCICSALYFFLVRKKMRDAGQESRRINIRMLKAVHQAIGGIKEVKVMGREDFFIHTYSSNGDAFVENEKKYALLAGLPKHLIEVFCVGGILTVVAVKIATHGELSTLIPSLTAFGVAAIRLLPTANSINSIINSITYQMPSLDAVCEVIDENFDDTGLRTEASGSPPSQTPFTPGDIGLEHVTFCYPGVEEPVLHNVSLTIHPGSSVGIMGVTGAGKTTLVDIILGLLTPQQGHVTFGGQDIRDNYPQWQKHIGYIPQSIYLVDESIRANVALGVPEKEIDNARVWQALEDAQLAEFVRGLKEGLDTVIGERGVRISGGQRQRIGIARALYYDPDILFFDEATSALDNATERAVMASINRLRRQKTIIVIAHRLSTIENCDYLYAVEDGQIRPATLN